MRKIGLAFAAGVAGIAVFMGSGSAQALTFDNDPCLDLSRMSVCDKHKLYRFVKLQGPTTNPCGMPWKEVVVGSC
ncbi:hypothetical protein ADL35_15865 [Streptomyces sp. NRRL WC-3753]|nr:hypothetical protein SMCF_7365 [Streptomyces coelicoflavus ZG0656]KPC85644.1 hypothetical protein ADL35_15865 [Streptomyces sp. NRRL WC-3753]MZE49224.1 hypothetical protein [Streptomyces sp. SID5477]